MGRSQLVSAGMKPLGYVALLFVLAACGEPESLLVAGDVESSVYGEDAGGGYGPSSTNEADFGSIAGIVRFEGTPIKQRNLKLSDNFCINANPGGIASEDFLFDPQSGPYPALPSLPSPPALHEPFRWFSTRELLKILVYPLSCMGMMHAASVFHKDLGMYEGIKRFG